LVGYLLVDFLASGEGQKFIGAEGGGKKALAQTLQSFLTPGRSLGGLLEDHMSLVVDTELHLAVGQQAALAADRQRDRDLALAGDPHGRVQAGG
jgi:hypothetical protein